MLNSKHAQLSCVAGPRRFLYRQTVGRLRSEEASALHHCVCWRCHACILPLDCLACITLSIFGILGWLKLWQVDGVVALQSVYLAAKRKSEQLGESVEGHAAEATKLTERLASAQTQYLDGMRKVKAASKQLQYLEKEVAGSEATANSEFEPANYDQYPASLYWMIAVWPDTFMVHARMKHTL